MDDLFDNTTPRRQPAERVRQFSFWKIWMLEHQLGLLRYANRVRRDLLQARIEEIRLEEQQQMLGGDRMWPSELGETMLYLPSTPALPSPVELEISQKEIEGLALRIVARLSNLPPAEATRLLESWKPELHRRLPSHAAAEVEARVNELRGLL